MSEPVHFHRWRLLGTAKGLTVPQRFETHLR
jgi:hypothetical protein